MTQNIYTDLVKQMHTQYGIQNNNRPSHLSAEEKDFRVACLQEELREYRESTTLEDELDSILDLIVFAFGTLERQGMLEIAEEAYKRIMKANMAKELGGTKQREGTPAFAIDLKKPAGWVAPNFDDLLSK